MQRICHRLPQSGMNPTAKVPDESAFEMLGYTYADIFTMGLTCTVLPVPYLYSRQFHLAPSLLCCLAMAGAALSQSGGPPVAELILQGHRPLDSGNIPLPGQDFEKPKQTSPQNFEVNRELVVRSHPYGRQ